MQKRKKIENMKYFELKVNTQIKQAWKFILLILTLL